MATPNVSDVQYQTPHAFAEGGYGFLVRDGTRPICSLTFRTRAEADDAHKLMSAAVAKAVYVAKT